MFDARRRLAVHAHDADAAVQGAARSSAIRVAMYLTDIFTVTANLAGLPALSLPIGRVQGLPVGGQLIGPAFLEDEMLEAAFTLERAVEPEAEA